MADDGPKIQIDSDWKAQAQAEKQRLADQAKAKEPAARTGAGAGAAAGGGGARQLPAASIEALVSTMATQALFAMGAIADPRSGQRMQNLDLARFHIDTLSLIEEKTKGNLTEEEQQLLSGTLFELRQRYVQISTALRGV
jgi:hypothetical protein